LGLDEVNRVDSTSLDLGLAFWGDFLGVEAGTALVTVNADGSGFVDVFCLAMVLLSLIPVSIRAAK
jgi:hypothetical protein